MLKKNFTNLLLEYDTCYILAIWQNKNSHSTSDKISQKKISAKTILEKTIFFLEQAHQYDEIDDEWMGGAPRGWE